jgi:hypothetical protein
LELTDERFEDSLRNCRNHLGAAPALRLDGSGSRLLRF